MNTPSYWLKKPSPMAAPRLARAGKHAAQPIAVTMAPITPALSAVRVRGLGMDMGMALDASVLNGGGVARIRRGADERSEEHTSELQSLMRNSYAVFCLQKKQTT